MALRDTGTNIDAIEYGPSRIAERLGVLNQVAIESRSILEALGDSAPKCAVEGINRAMENAVAANNAYVAMARDKLESPNRDAILQQMTEVRDATSAVMRPLSRMWEDGPSQWKYPDFAEVVIPLSGVSATRSASSYWKIGYNSFGDVMGPPQQWFLLAKQGAVGTSWTARLAGGILSALPTVRAFVVVDTIAGIFCGDPSPLAGTLAGQLRAMLNDQRETSQYRAIRDATKKGWANVKSVYKQLYAMRQVILASGGDLEKFRQLLSQTNPENVPSMPDRWDGTWPPEAGGPSASPTNWTIPLLVLIGLGVAGILVASGDRS